MQVWRKSTNDTKCGQTEKDVTNFFRTAGKCQNLLLKRKIPNSGAALHSRMVSNLRTQRSIFTIKESKRKNQKTQDQARRSAPQKQIVLPHRAPELYKTCTWFAVVPKPSLQIRNASTTGSAGRLAPAVRSSYFPTLSAAEMYI